jgi:hypothetical protein
MQGSLTTYMLKYKCVDKTTGRLRKMVNIIMTPYGDNNILIYKIAEAMYSISDNEIDTEINSFEGFCSKYTDFNVSVVNPTLNERNRYLSSEMDDNIVIREEWDILLFTHQIFKVYKSFA